MTVYPVMSPAACRYLRLKLETAVGVCHGGLYCSYLRQFIVSGARGTCVGCEQFSEESQTAYSRVRLP